MSLIWMPPHTTVPPLRVAASAAGTSAPTGREDQRRVELLGRALVRAAGPYRAEAAREILRRRCRPARVKAKTSRPWWRATCATMCAAAPKP